MSAEVHPDVAILAPLVGTWVGHGAGEYPTIDPFEYDETVVFAPSPKPFLSYQQRTTAADDGRPLHAEAAYWRVPSPGLAEIVVAQPSGITEILEGSVGPNDTPDSGTIIIDVRSTAIGSTSTAKEVRRTERTFEVTGDIMRYTMRMAAVGQPLTHHLSATLHRQ